jgi:asparagine synthase (glutamine-hydrolysing)
MCGIFGVLSNGARERTAAANDLSIGMDRIRHRGPDGSGQWISENGQIALGHVRLSIIDIDSGAQPMMSEDGRYTIIYNGEIFNYIELRNELGIANFRTRSDTEVILKAFQRWKGSCLSRLRGMFAFAIWDSLEQKLFLARDRFGIKPLYWASTDSGFYFASEAKALLPFIGERRTNKSALSDYFTFQFCLGEKTLIDSVNQMPAAHCMVLNAEERFPVPNRYWEVQYDIDYEHTERWFVERLKDLLNDSVRMHLRSDVEIGSYVSGGVDSSLLAAIAREHRPTGSFKAFNGRFSDSLDFDE